MHRRNLHNLQLLCLPQSTTDFKYNNHKNILNQLNFNYRNQNELKNILISTIYSLVESSEFNHFELNMLRNSHDLNIDEWIYNPSTIWMPDDISREIYSHYKKIVHSVLLKQKPHILENILAENYKKFGVHYNRNDKIIRDKYQLNQFIHQYQSINLFIQHINTFLPPHIIDMITHYLKSQLHNTRLTFLPSIYD